MEIIHLAIDTNIFRDNPIRDKVEFKALKILVSNNKVKIYMPYIIEQEFITQQIADCKKINKELLKNIDSLSKRRYTNKKFTSKLLKDIQALEANTCELIQSEFDTWCTEFKIEKRSLNKDHLQVVIENYFEGDDPFKSQKNRNDIPDAFVFQELKEILNEKGNLTFITQDNFFRESCIKVGVNSHESLEHFIKDSKIQFLLKEHEVTKEKFTELKEYLARNTAYLEDKLAFMHIPELENETINDYSIPSDDNSAEITSLYSPYNIKLDCLNTVYYGGDTISIPAKFDIDVNASFAIFKPDYYVNEYDFPVEDLNKHYYLAEDEFTLEVIATVILTIDINAFDFTKELTEEIVEEMVNLDSIKVDSIESIEVKEERESKEVITFICSNCKQSHNLSCDDLEWEITDSDERQMGTQIYHVALYENVCDCGNGMSFTFNCWEYPIGFIDHVDIQSSGVDNIIGECVPQID